MNTDPMENSDTEHFQKREDAKHLLRKDPPTGNDEIEGDARNEERMDKDDDHKEDLEEGEDN